MKVAKARVETVDSLTLAIDNVNEENDYCRLDDVKKAQFI